MLALEQLKRDLDESGPDGPGGNEQHRPAGVRRRARTESTGAAEVDGHG
jgi:hypothetical protein